MESPFSKSSTISMFLEPILDPFSQTYIDAITFSDMPPGPISTMVKRLSLRKLSEFHTVNSNSNLCSFILLRYPVSYSRGINYNSYMGLTDIPSIFSYLRSNGYIIEDGLTRMIQRGGFTTDFQKQTICMFSYPSI